MKDPAAARGLALAYASLDETQRRDIVDAVVADAHAEGIAGSAVLVPLLSVEEDVEVARYIADAIGELGGCGLETGAATRALAAGDEEQGGVLVIRPLHGTFTEVIGLAWMRDQGVTHTEFEPMVHDGEAGNLRGRLPEQLHFETVPVDYAIDLVTPVLWHHRRTHGVLPDHVGRFVDLFSIEPEPDRAER